VQILIADDDPIGRTLALRALAGCGVDVLLAEDGHVAWGFVRERTEPTVLVLDRLMPGIDGLDLCRRARLLPVSPPLYILMVTGASETADVTAGLEAGADDYVVKPFRPAELRSRIRAVLRRVGPGPRADAPLTAGAVTLDPGLREVQRDGRPVALTFSEFELLHALMSQSGRVHSRHDLLRAIWGDSAYRDPRAIDVHVRHLREKLEAVPEQPELIVTVRGAGYRIGEP
jgi:DNA-binding response OmpR family regulator